MEKIDRFRGSLLGLACGDAVGTTVEFKARGTFTPVTDMRGGGPFALKKGEWTDDTSMALCLASSLVELQRFDARDQMQRYCRWMDEGFYSSNGTCFDIGRTVEDALEAFKESGEPYSGSTDRYAAGNGCLMRLAPIPMFFSADRTETIRYAALGAKTTHGAQECLDASMLFADMLFLALSGATKEAILNEHSFHDGAALSPTIAPVAQGTYRQKSIDDVRGTGYVVDSLEAALWCFSKGETFEETILLAANLGDDADTTAAIAGQLAGAFYGVQAIPPTWLEHLAMRTEITELADKLFAVDVIKPDDLMYDDFEDAGISKDGRSILLIECDRGRLRARRAEKKAQQEAHENEVRKP